MKENNFLLHSSCEYLFTPLKWTVNKYKMLKDYLTVNITSGYKKC